MKTNLSKNRMRELISHIDENIAKLQKQRDYLSSQLTDESLVLKIKDYAWVIEKSKNRYYQYLYNGNGNVFLHRKSTHRIVSEEFFNQHFVIANPAQVEQHLKHLSSVGSSPITNLPYKSTEHYVKKLMDVAISEDSGTNVNIRANFVEPVQKKSSFYMVTVKGEKGSKVRHEDYGTAEKEAIRLATNENHDAFILGVVATVKPIITHEIIKSVTTVNL